MKATQTEDVEEEDAADVEGGGEEEEGEEGRSKKSFLTSKLARLLSFSQ